MLRNSLNNKYSHLALGGTFDHFHKGHQYFLKKALSISKKVTIGITSDKFAKLIHKSALIQSFKVRKNKVQSFVNKFNGVDTQIIELNDIFGPTVCDEKYDALLVTKNTIKSAKLINNRRQKLGNKKLEIIKCPLMKAEDGKCISSSRIRNGEIDRKGTHFCSRLLEYSPITISKKMRKTLRKPFGKVFKGEMRNHQKVFRKIFQYINKKKLTLMIGVGDDVTSSLLSIKAASKLSIVDLHIQRKRKYQHIMDHNWPKGITHSRVKNPAGMITVDLIKAVKINLENKTISAIEVIGEEDLAVLPCVLLAPLNSVVLYGHFQYGIVLVEVTEGKKNEALKLLYKLR